MNILGMIGFGWNPGACLLVDGKLIAFAEEERFTRLKSSHGLFPGRAIDYCLREASLKLHDVDRIAFGWDASKYPYRMLQTMTGQYLRYRSRASRAYHRGAGGRSVLSALSNIMLWTPSRLREEIKLGLRAHGFKGEIPRIEFISHHLAHAYSAYYCSAFNEALILTLDGSGEDNSTQLAIGRGQQVTVKETVPIPHSLGWYYAAFTEYLGFIPYRDEGKLMGLAAVGESRKDQNPWRERLETVIRLSNGMYEVDPIYTRMGGHYYGARFTDALVKFITEFDPDMEPVMYGEKCFIDGTPQSKYLLPKYVDLAWAVQDKLEEITRSIVTRAVREYGIRNLCVAGGVGLNCKMNGELLRSTPVEQIFVQPASNDAGTALGAAMIVAQRYGDPIRNELEHVYYGPGFSNDEIKKALDGCKVAYEACDNIAERVAECLAQGDIVGWFQGRMEFGARALGGRSILANPVIPAMKDKVNNQVKYRESWRPFCPSLLSDSKDSYLQGAAEAPFMIVAFPVQEEKRHLIPAAVHVDGTVRPQTIKESSNPRFHHLIKTLEKHTGHAVVVNTSFNVRGEPIVCTPLEAIRCYFSTGLDVLAIGEFLLTKR
jgi:carbamoyltransferase